MSMKNLSTCSSKRYEWQRRLTQRAADGGYVPHFRAGFWPEALPCGGPLQPSPPPLTLTVRCFVANKFNHFKLWLYQKMGVGWSAHWSPDGELLAVYYLPTIVRYGGSAPNTVLQSDICPDCLGKCYQVIKRGTPVPCDSCNGTGKCR